MWVPHMCYMNRYLQKVILRKILHLKMRNFPTVPHSFMQRCIFPLMDLLPSSQLRFPPSCLINRYDDKLLYSAYKNLRYIIIATTKWENSKGEENWKIIPTKLWGGDEKHVNWLGKFFFVLCAVILKL